MSANTDAARNVRSTTSGSTRPLIIVACASFLPSMYIWPSREVGVPPCFAPSSDFESTSAPWDFLQPAKQRRDASRTALAWFMAKGRGEPAARLPEALPARNDCDRVGDRVGEHGVLE